MGLGELCCGAGLSGFEMVCLSGVRVTHLTYTSSADHRKEQNASFKVDRGWVKNE